MNGEPFTPDMLTLFEFMNGLLEFWLPVFAIPIGIAGGFALARILRDIFLNAMGDLHDLDIKKDYQDEMSIYDDAPVQEITTLPAQTGISIDELFTVDGELPDAVFTEKRKQ